MPDISLQLLTALEKHWCKYRKYRRLCRKQMLEDPVHDLRTTSRKLLSLFDLLRIVHPRAGFGKLRQLFKTQLSRLNQLRDTQVMRLEIGGVLAEFPELADFYRHLGQSERILQRQSRALLREQKLGKIKRKLKKTIRICRKPQQQKPLHNLAILQEIDAMYALALARLQAIDATDLTTFHQLRLSVKKLRSVIVDSQACLPDYPEQQLAAMQNYLTHMGDIQNSVVLRQALQDFFGGATPEKALDYYAGRQQALIDEFLVCKADLLGFWRGNPPAN